MRIGVTGHMNLSDETVPLVAAQIRARLEAFADRASGLTGISCLARGADTVFARVVLELGGDLEVVLPSADYRATKVEADHAAAFDELLSAAAVVHTMPSETADREAYEAANTVMLGSADRLFAVWDGKPPADKGGTAAAVADARARGLPVDVIWPEGSRRD